MRRDFWNTAVARQLQPSQIERGVFEERQAKPLLKGFPVGEKLLYLFSVLICVALALIVTSKHAKVAELNLGIQNMDTRVQEMNKMNVQLQTQKEQLSSIENIRTFAEHKGLELSLPKILPS